MSDKPWYDQSKPVGETPSQLSERLKREQQHRDKIRAATAKLAEKPKTRDQQIEARYQAQLDALRRDFSLAASDAERSKLATSIKMYEGELHKLQAKMKEERRQAAFKDSELYGLMKDYTDALARSGDVTHPDVPTDAKDLLITIVRSVDLFDSPQEMHSKFTEQLRVVEDAQFAAEKKKQAELRHAALVGEVAAAQKDVRTLEAEKRVAKAEGKIE